MQESEHRISPTYSPLYNGRGQELAGYTSAITKERLDWAQVRQHATHLSTALVKKYGLHKTDTVAIFSQNSVWYLVALYAAIRVGARVTGPSPAYGVDEMTHALKITAARFIITAPNCVPVAAAAVDKVGIPHDHIFTIEGEFDGFTTIKELIKIGKNYGKSGQVPACTIPAGLKNGEVCAFLNFSSGTTGLPKAVMLSHQNAIAQIIQLDQITPKEPKRKLGVLPFSHIAGLLFTCLSSVFLNEEVVLCPSFNMPSMISAISEFKLTDMILVPPIVIRLVHDLIVDNYDLSSVKRIVCGAAPLSNQIIQLLAQKLPHWGFGQAYGMTECFSIAHHPPEFYDFKYGDAGGTLFANTVVKIVDEDGNELGYNQPGKILVRGPQIAMGYLNNEAATRETFDADGFLHTGDIGTIDEAGFIHITDRIKEMIKVKGIAVAPAELEDLLLGHPDVEDCAVLGILDDYAGERPKAYVVLKPGRKPSEDMGRRLLAYVMEKKKARYKWIREVEFAESVPKSPSGKILRRVLRDKERRKTPVGGGSGSGSAYGLVVKLQEGERTKL